MLVAYPSAGLPLSQEWLACLRAMGAQDGAHGREGDM